MHWKRKIRKSVRIDPNLPFNLTVWLRLCVNDDPNTIFAEVCLNQTQCNPSICSMTGCASANIVLKQTEEKSKHMSAGCHPRCYPDEVGNLWHCGQCATPSLTQKWLFGGHKHMGLRNKYYMIRFRKTVTFWFQTMLTLLSWLKIGCVIRHSTLSCFVNYVILHHLWLI